MAALSLLPRTPGAGRADRPLPLRLRRRARALSRSSSRTSRASSRRCRSPRRSSGCGSGAPTATRSSSRSTTAFATSSTNAAPLLAEHGFNACFFLVTDLAGGDAGARRGRSAASACTCRCPVEPLDWDGAARLLELGHEVGSHTRSHPDLTALAPDELEEELTASRDRARRCASAPCAHFSAPYGERGALLRRPSPTAARDGRATRAARRRSAGRNTSALDLYALRRDHLSARWPLRERRVLPRVNVVVLTRNPRGIASRFLAAAARAGRSSTRATGADAAPDAAEAAPRRADRGPGRARAAARVRRRRARGRRSRSVATEVVRVPTLNGEEARAALRRLGADVALSLDNALIREATFALPRARHDQRPPRRGARTTAAARRCSGSSPTAATRSASRSTASTPASTPGRCSRAARCRSSGARR